MKHLIAAGVLLMAALGAWAQQGLRMAYVAPPAVWGPIADRFAAEVAQRTQGSLQITAVGGGQLGTLAQNFAGIRIGQIDLMLTDSLTLALARGGQDFNVLASPYLFRDSAHFRAFMQGPLFASLLAPVEREGGFVYLGLVAERAPRQLTTRSVAVRRPEDLKGLRIRVPELPTAVEAFKAWGAVPTPIPAADLYLALKQGTVEGQDNGFDSILRAHLNEVQRYATRIDYVRSGVIVLIAAERWTHLAPAQQAALKAAVEQTERWATPQLREEAAREVQALREQGMTILEPDLTPFRALALEAQRRLDGSLWSAGLLDKIRTVPAP